MLSINFFRINDSSQQLFPEISNINQKSQTKAKLLKDFSNLDDPYINEIVDRKRVV